MNTNTTKEILQQIFEERNLSESSKNTYRISVRHFEEITETNLENSIRIAETEENNNPNWKKSYLRSQLIKYRSFVFKNYKKNTAKVYFTNIKTIFKHFEITIGELPYFSLKSANESTPIYYDDLPTREIIKKGVELSNPKMTAMILLMSSSGFTKVDTLKLSVKSFLESTIDYHKSNIQISSLNILNEIEDDIIPTWKLKRQKTNKNFFTFSSPESTEAILIHLKTVDNLTLNSKLFEIGSRYTNMYFKEINDKLGLSNVGNYAKFRPHMLRKYHASQLYRAGMAQDKIDLLQGRSPSSTHQSYFKEDPISLKDEYIKCLPYLVLDESKKFKTQLDLEKEKNSELEHQNKLKDEKMIVLEERLEKVESIFEGVDMDELKSLRRFM